MAVDLGEPFRIVIEHSDMYGFGTDAMQRRPVQGRLLDRPDRVARRLRRTHHGDA